VPPCASVRRLTIATSIGCTYFLVAATEMLPHQTAGEKRVVLVMSIAVLLILLTLFTLMIRMRMHRKRVAKEWKEKSGITSE